MELQQRRHVKSDQPPKCKNRPFFRKVLIFTEALAITACISGASLKAQSVLTENRSSTEKNLSLADSIAAQAPLLENLADEKQPVGERLEIAPGKETPVAPSNGNKLKLAQVKSSELAGFDRLKLELNGERKLLWKYQKKYLKVVNRIAKSIAESENAYGGEFDFFIGMRDFYNDSLKAIYGSNKYGFLYESLDSNKYDCENSSILAYDVAKKLGLAIGVVFAPGRTGFHMLVKGEEHFMETVIGSIRPVSVFHLLYPKVFDIVSDKKKLQPPAYNTLGGYYARNNMLNEAMMSYVKAIRLNPNYLTSRIGISYCYTKKVFLGLRNKEAEEHMKIALGLRPDLPVLYIRSSVLHRRLGNIDRALQDIDNAIGLVDSQIEKLHLESISLEIRKDEMTGKEYNDYLSALSLAKTLREMDKKEYLRRRGNVNLRNGQPGAAIEDYSSALELGIENGGDVEIYRNRGRAYEKIGRKKNARNDRSSANLLEKKLEAGKNKAEQ